MTIDSATRDRKTVQELRSMAEEAARHATKAPPRNALSRAARLSLIDQLSRLGASGLALFLGATVFIAVVTARAQPATAAFWALLVFAALYLCRRYRREFRRGDKIAARPFRWRAYYTATLVVVSAAFGTGAFLLLPAATDRASIEILTVMLATAAGAAALHAAHLKAAAAAFLPALAAAAGASFSTLGPTTFSMIFVATGAVAAVAIAFAGAMVARRAAARFPRTTIVRREVERRRASRALPLVTERAAAT